MREGNLAWFSGNLVWAEAEQMKGTMCGSEGELGRASGAKFVSK